MLLVAVISNSFNIFNNISILFISISLKGLSCSPVDIAGVFSLDSSKKVIVCSNVSGFNIAATGLISLLFKLCICFDLASVSFLVG